MSKAGSISDFAGALAVASHISSELRYIEDLFKAGKGSEDIEKKYMALAKKRNAILDKNPAVASIAAIVAVEKQRALMRRET